MRGKMIGAVKHALWLLDYHSTVIRRNAKARAA